MRLRLRLQRLFASLDQFSRKVAGLRSNLGGSLSIRLLDNIIADPNSPIAATVAKLVEVAPALHLLIETRSPGELLRDVVAQKLDFVVGSVPRMALGLAYIDLYEETQNFYCRAGHPLFSVADRSIDIDRVRMHRSSRAATGRLATSGFSQSQPRTPRCQTWRPRPS